MLPKDYRSFWELASRMQETTELFVFSVAKTTQLLILAFIICLSFMGKVKDGQVNWVLQCSSGANLKVESNPNKGGALQLH